MEQSKQAKSPVDAAARTGARRRPLFCPGETRSDLTECSFEPLWPLAPEVVVPTLSRRLAACLLDIAIGLPLLPLAGLTVDVMSGLDLQRSDFVMRTLLTTFLLYAFYFAYWESSPVRATPGKILTDLRVSGRSSAAISFTDALLRYVLRGVTVLLAGLPLLVSARHAHGRAWHDQATRSVVTSYWAEANKVLAHPAQRPRRDWVATAAFALMAGWLTFGWAPEVYTQLRWSDRLESALIELTPVLASGSLVDGHGRWSTSVREAYATIRDLGLGLRVDAEQQSLQLFPAGDAGPPLALELVRAPTPRAAETEIWNCVHQGLAAYARPRHCTELIGQYTSYLGDDDVVLSR